MHEDRAISRRALLGGAAVIGVTIAFRGFSPPEVAWSEEPEVEPSDIQYGFWVDTSKCDNCNKCVEACREYNKTPEKVEARRKITEYENEGGDIRYVTTSCMHCAIPSCEAVCPAKAIVKRQDGIVDIKPDRCIGCKYCYQACPFGVPHYTSKAMDKCDCCLGAGIEAGDMPYCVQKCPEGALNYGTTEDLVALSGKTAQPIVASTGPSYFLS